MSVIVRFREHAGLSQNDVALALGVSQTTVSQWEMGTRHPRPRRAAG